MFLLVDRVEVVEDQDRQQDKGAVELENRTRDAVEECQRASKRQKGGPIPT